MIIMNEIKDGGMSADSDLIVHQILLSDPSVNVFNTFQIDGRMFFSVSKLIKLMNINNHYQIFFQI